MSSKITKEAYEKLIAEDIEWLEKQPHSLENDHIKAIVRDSVNFYYPEKKEIKIDVESFVRSMETGRRKNYEDDIYDSYQDDPDRDR